MVNLPPAIEFHNAAHTYRIDHNNTKQALQPCNINIQPGEWVSVMGANGSGKSTLARLCKGLIMPTAGQVNVLGACTASHRFAEISHEVAYLSQHPEHHIAGPTVEDDIALALRAHGLTGSVIQERIAEALTTVGMLHKAQHEFDALSGGEIQLAALAGILACHPRVIVLDEPTAYADQHTQQKVWRVVQQMYERTRPTVVWVTHNRQEACLAKRTLVLQQGRIVFDGPTAELWQQNDTMLSQWGIEPLFPAQRTTKSTSAYNSASHGEQAVVSLENVCFRYDEASPYVLAGMNLHLDAGERVALVGPIGSGKSTLIQVATGLEQHEAGHVTVVGTTLPPKGNISRKQFQKLAGRIHQRIALCLQQPELQLYEASVEDEFHSLFRDSGVPAEVWEEKIVQTLAKVGLDCSILKQSPFALSGGERRKVALAMTLALDASAYVVDEPTVGLDYPSRVLVAQALLATSQKSQAALLISTHDEYIVQTVATRQVQLGRDRVENSASQKVQDDPGVENTPHDVHLRKQRKRARWPMQYVRQFFMQVDARLHVIGASLLALSVTAVRSWWALLYGLCIVVVLSAIAVVPWRRVGAVLGGLVPFAVAAGLFAQLPDSYDAGPAFASSVVYGLFIGLRLAVVIFSVMWVTQLLRLPDVLFAMRSLLKPLQIIRIPIGILIGGTLIGMRMLPIIVNEATQLRRMQHIRGQRQVRRALSERIAEYVIPLSAAVIRRAERLGEALQAKGLTHDVLLFTEPFYMNRRHAAFIVFFVIMLSGFIVFSGYGGSMT